MPGLRWGILGTGGIAAMFAGDLRTAGLTLQAVGSRRRESAQAFAARFAAPHAHGSYDELCADDTVDAIYVATPHPMHHADALRALRAGKHVLIEKPVALNAAQARDIADAAAAAGRFAMEAMWTRFLPHMLRIRELLGNGELGGIRAVTADHTQKLPDDPGHRLNDLSLGGGALLDLGIYPISYTYEVFGTPSTVTAHAVFKDTGADAQVATVFGYAGGQLATTVSSSVAAGPNLAAIIGDAGYLEIDPVWYQATGFRRYDSDRNLVETFTPAVEGRGMQYEALEVERSVAEGRIESAVLPMTDSVAIMEIMDEVRRQIGLRYPGE